MRLLVGLILLSQPALAVDYFCESYPEMCAENPNKSSAQPSFSSQISSNPSSLPTIPTPPGFELGYDTSGDFSESGWNVAGVKGMPRLGLGFSTEDNNTFYTYNLRQATQGTPLTDMINGVFTSSTIRETATLAGSFALLKHPGPFSPVVGLSIIYDELISTFNLGYGLSINTPVISLGASYAPLKGKLDKQVPETSTLQWSAGIKLGKFSLDYSNLSYRTSDTRLQNLRLFDEAVHYISGTYSYKKVHITASTRRSYNIFGQKIHRELVSAHWQVFTKLGIGYKMNYLVGAHSFSAQIHF